ncbi:MAG: branched-chain amino acid ABC transporter substrate-binding protein [Nitratireductor sp.]|nr:branched-chain amino acid ABC transporter substrate-binding protein [Nitratireductor sp.]
MALLAVAIAPLPAAAQRDNQRRIGISLPLSGDVERLGRQFLAGARLKLQEFNAEAGGTADLAIVDDRCDEGVAALAADELRQSGVSLVTGILCNGVARVLADALQPDGTAILVAGARSERLTADRNRLRWKLWRLAPGDGEAARVAALALSKRWNGKAYAIVDDGTVYGRGLADRFREAMEEAGLPPQFQDNFRPTQSTQARLVRRLRRSGVTHAFVGADAEDTAMIARNAREIGVPLTLAGGDVLSILPFSAADQQPPDGLLAVLSAYETAATTDAAIAERFLAAGVEPEPYALQGYRALEVALAALGDTTAATADNLDRSRFDTLLGPVEFDGNGANMLPIHGLFEWRDGAFRRLDP